jgi:hypothetical protein
MKKVCNFDMWSIRDYGPKGGKTTKHFVKINFVNENGVTVSYSPYVFKKYDDAKKKYIELWNKVPLNIKIGKINNYLMHNAWYLMPPHYGNFPTDDLFNNDNYTDETCFTNPYYTQKGWVIKYNKFAEKMMKAA